jgi:DNA-binding transcriptional ArsR family regulator
MAAASLHHPAVEDLQLEGVLHALSDPVRLQMVREPARRDEPCACGTIDVPVSKSTRTHHWRVLRENGLVTQVEAGTAKLTELRRDDLDARFPGLLAVVLREEPATTTASLRA